MTIHPLGTLPRIPGLSSRRKSTSWVFATRPRTTPDDFRAVIALLWAGKFPMDVFITSEVPFADADSALQRWSDDPRKVSKIHLVVA